MPVITQRQQKTVEVSQIQHVDKIVNATVDAEALSQIHSFERVEHVSVVTQVASR